MKNPHEIGQLADVITRLNAARRAARLYPPGHVSIDTALNGAFAALSQLIQIQAPLILRASKKALMLAGVKLRRDHPACQEMARVLYDHEIAAAVFQRELTSEDLAQFIALLNEPPSSHVKEEKSRSRIPHVFLRGIDYRNLKLTVESAISPDGVDSREEDLAFLRQPAPASQASVAPSPESPSERLMGEDMTNLTEVVGRYRKELDSAVNSYEQELHSHFSPDPGVSPEFQEGQAPSVWERIEMLDAFSKKLRPSLSRQLLSLDLKGLATNRRFIGLDDIIGNENAAFIFETLQKANQSDQEISPTLIGLIRKLLASVTEETRQSDSSAIDELGKMLKENPLEGLFKREDYERYVIPEYDALLKRLSRDRPPETTPQDGELPADAHLDTFLDSHLAHQVHDASLRLLEGDLLDDGLYRDITAYLIQQSIQMIADGVLGPVTRFFVTLRRHMDEKASVEMRETAEACFHRLKSSEVITRALSAVTEAEEPADAGAIAFFMEQGPSVVPLALNAFIGNPNPSHASFFQAIFDQFREETLSAALSRIYDPDPRTVKRVMTLLGRMGDSHCASEIEPLLSHPDWGVRREAISALVQFDHPAAIAKVRSLIRARDPRFSEFAIQTAGRFALRACVPELAVSLRMGCFTHDAIHKNELIVRALGQIGDPAAVPYLERIARKKWTFRREALARLKLTLFTTLENYPPQPIGELLRLGKAASDIRIRNLTAHLSKPAGGELERRFQATEDRRIP